MRTSIARRTLITVATCLLFGVMSLGGGAGAVLPPGGTSWNDQLTGPGRRADFGRAVTVSPDGSRTFVTGWITNVDTERDYLTVAYDTGTGAILWSNRRVVDGYQEAAAIVADASTVYVTGEDVTVAYDAATGAQRWLQPFAGPVPWGGDEGTAIAARDGAVFVTGLTLAGMQTVIYDAATGAQRWVQRYAHGTIPVHPGSLALSPDGTTVAMTGAQITWDARDDYVTVAYDAATGQQRWLRLFDGKAAAMDLSTSLDVTAEAVVVTGSSTDASGLDVATIAYDLVTGETRWVRRYDGPSHGNETVPSLSLSPDLAAAYVITRSASPSGGFDYETIAYATANGATLWKTRLTVGVPGYAYFPPAIQASPDGTRVIVTGRTAADEYLTVAFGAADGTRLWARRFERWGRNAPSDLAISPDGATVVVTGTSWSWDRIGSDFATVAYRAR